MHYQGRISFVKKLGKPSAIEWLLDNGVKDFNISETSKDESTRDAFYCAKAATRMEPAFTDKDYKEKIPDTIETTLIKEKGMYPWQSSILELVTGYDNRHIHMVVNPGGNIGKSAFRTYLMQTVAQIWTNSF